MTKYIDITKFPYDSEVEPKKTVFTHYLDEKQGWEKPDSEEIAIFLENAKRIVYLGECSSDGDMFALTSSVGTIVIFKGLKGDEF
ncbi:MAG: hypothetical protein EKK63_15760 [Acinetobacter sp.]|uniref:hypothetical protein n=1 Tax=Acinetobacter sp. TaxID=472 RepID=UPI000FAEB6C7|nr:hypothetical protein [Acinetobacter sp.]RUP37025.1 MAG: hypothetical protein EKK63_15760 [Acinetobacter sp.]